MYTHLAKHFSDDELGGVEQVVEGDAELRRELPQVAPRRVGNPQLLLTEKELENRNRKLGQTAFVELEPSSHDPSDDGVTEPDELPRVRERVKIQKPLDSARRLLEFFTVGPDLSPTQFVLEKDDTDLSCSLSRYHGHLLVRIGP
jgi:hypothetical protein